MKEDKQERLERQRKAEQAQIKNRRTPQSVFSYLLKNHSQFFGHRILNRFEKAGFKKELATPGVRRALISHKVFQVQHELIDEGSRSDRCST